MIQRIHTDRPEILSIGEREADGLSIFGHVNWTVGLMKDDGETVQLPPAITRISALREDYTRKLVQLDGQELIRRSSGRVYTILTPHRNAIRKEYLEGRAEVIYKSE